MLEKYKDLNDSSKIYLTKEIEVKFYKKYKDKDKELLDRCYKELDLLYDESLLFIIEYLYKYKKKDKSINYYFKGTVNNLLIIYILELSNVNPVTYNLPFELFNDKVIKVELLNFKLDFIKNIEEINPYFKIISGTFEKEEIEEINKLEENHYLLIPNEFIDDIPTRLNDSGILETIDDYRIYKQNYIPIKIDKKNYINNNIVEISNVLDNDFEFKLDKILKPNSIDDYIKIKSISHGTNVWNNNQDILIKNNIINIKNLIANREDVFEYLINHNIDKNISIEIINFIRKGKQQKSLVDWNKYIEIMKQNNCDDLFIEIISKIKFIYGRGHAVSECLFVLDNNNYKITE